VFQLQPVSASAATITNDYYYGMVWLITNDHYHGMIVWLITNEHYYGISGNVSVTKPILIIVAAEAETG